jgi:hypothetical protein
MDYGTIDRDLAMRLATWPEETDGPVLMVNLMRYRDVARYSTDGHPNDGDEAISGREADDRYAPIDVLDKIGARPVYFGDVAGVEDDRDVRWDRVGIVRYATRRSFIEMQSREDFRAKRVHKDAGMAFTIVMPSIPARRAMETDPTVRVTSLVVWPRGGDVPDVTGAAIVLEVEGRIIGDEREWDAITLHHGDDVVPHPHGGIVLRMGPVMIDELAQVVADWVG